MWLWLFWQNVVGQLAALEPSKIPRLRFHQHHFSSSNEAVNAQINQPISQWMNEECNHSVNSFIQSQSVRYLSEASESIGVPALSQSTNHWRAHSLTPTATSGSIMRTKSVFGVLTHRASRQLSQVMFTPRTFQFAHCSICRIAWGNWHRPTWLPGHKGEHFSLVTAEPSADVFYNLTSQPPPEPLGFNEKTFKTVRWSLKNCDADTTPILFVTLQQKRVKEEKNHQKHKMSLADVGASSHWT